MSIFATKSSPTSAWILLAFLSACGGPIDTQPAVVPPQAMRMERFTLRYQAGEGRFVEITGDSAVLNGVDLIDMDSLVLTFYRDNLELVRLAAPAGRSRISGQDSGTVTLKHPEGRLYYGGKIHADRMTLSFENKTWTADGAVKFDRDPLRLSADSAAGPLTMDEILANRAELSADRSAAQGASILIQPGSRRVTVRGKAVYRSDTVTLTGDQLQLTLDPTFTRLTPLQSKSSPRGD